MRANQTSLKTLCAALAAVLVASCGGGKPATKNIVMEPEQVVAERPATAEPVQPEARPAEPAEPPPPELTFPQDEFRAKQPAGGPARPLQLPSVTRFKTKGGIQVYLVEDHVTPVVQASLVLEGGTINDPVGKEGLAALCVATMNDSTAQLDRNAFAEAQSDLASEVSAMATRDQQMVSFDALTKSLDATADLWSALLLTPGMRQEDFDRNKKRSLANLQQQKAAPTGVAQRLWGSVLYGPAHPLGRFPSEKSYEAITLDDCKKYVADYFKPQGAQLWVVGDIDRAGVEALVDKRLGGWKGKPKASVKPGKPQTRKGKIFLVDVPGAPQSVINMAHFGPDRKSKDYFAVTMVGGALGGGFQSRINLNLREKNGYAYGAFGNFGYTRWWGTFMASSNVRTDATSAAVLEMYNEMKSMAEGGPTEEELTRQRNDLAQSLPADFETGASVLAQFRMLVYFGLPLDWFKGYVAAVNKVDLKAAKAAAKKHLKPGEVVVFVVGDASVVRPGLEKLLADKSIGAGELVVLDVEGQVVK
jgi:zinc protease